MVRAELVGAVVLVTLDERAGRSRHDVASLACRQRLAERLAPQVVHHELAFAPRNEREAGQDVEVVASR